MYHGRRCRRQRQVWRRKTSHGAEDASGGGRHIGKRKMHLEAEEAEEAEAEFEMERRGGRGFPLQSRRRVKSSIPKLFVRTSANLKPKWRK